MPDWVTQKHDAVKMWRAWRAALLPVYLTTLRGIPWQDTQ